MADRPNGTAVIFDNGSGLFKAGMGDDDTPRVVFPTIYGKPINPNIMVGMDQKDLYVGPEANHPQKKPLLSIFKPIKVGVIEDMENMEKIWDYTYQNELMVDRKEHPALLTEPPLNDPKKREQLMTVFFENIEVNHFYLSITSVLGLYSTGRTTGLVLDSGAGVTHTVPVYEGFALPFATNQLPIAGDVLTEYLKHLLIKEAGIKVNESDPSIMEDIEKKIKEKICYVAFDIDTSRKESDDKDKVIHHTLPDGQTFSITKAHFTCPEALFQPNSLSSMNIMNTLNMEGIHDKTFNSILKCENHIQKSLYKNIVLIGGSTMFKGLGVRLKKEVSALAPSTMDINMYEPLERKYSAWIGGSILSTIDAFRHLWISKGEYQEAGVSIVHKKCF